MDALVSIVSSRVKAEVFRLLLGPALLELHVREIARRAHLNDATVRQELKRLVKLGVIEARRDGNRKYFRANTQHPLFTDLRNLVLKTSGLVELLQRRLRHPGIKLAFVFGSLAAGTEKAHSDIDLMVIGKLGLRELSSLTLGLTHQIGREINPHVMSVDEFVRRKKAREHFLTTVLNAPKLFVIGGENELAGLGR